VKRGGRVEGDRFWQAVVDCLPKRKRDSGSLLLQFGCEAECLLKLHECQRVWLAGPGANGGAQTCSIPLLVLFAERKRTELNVEWDDGVEDRLEGERGANAERARSGQA
jgi:hypothetical protein